jgi:hypothetical protein
MHTGMQEERMKFGEDLISDTVKSDNRRFMSLLIKVEERETIQECLDIVLDKLNDLEEENKTVPATTIL